MTGIMLLSGLRVVKEYDRLVIMRMGKVIGQRGPGLQLVIPFFERSQKVDTRVITMEIPPQDAITKDNVTLKVAAVCFFQVQDPCRAVIQIEDPIEASGQVAQSSLRLIIGRSDLDELLSQRDQINQRLSAMVDSHTEAWGIKIQSIEIKDLELPLNMKRSMARQAESERLRRARVTSAEGEAQAAPKLAEAAAIIFKQEGAFNLRRMQSIMEVSSEGKTTLVIPTPMRLTPRREDESEEQGSP